MSMNLKDAKAWANADPEKRDWRDQWKHGQILRGIGLKKGKMIFEWGPGGTPAQKMLLEDCIFSPSKWASKVEEILGNPPGQAQRQLLKVMKRLKIR